MIHLQVEKVTPAAVGRADGRDTSLEAWRWVKRLLNHTTTEGLERTCEWEGDLGDSTDILVIGYVTALKNTPSDYLQKELILEKYFFNFSQVAFLLVWNLKKVEHSLESLGFSLWNKTFQPELLASAICLTPRTRLIDAKMPSSWWSCSIAICSPWLCVGTSN